MPIIMALEPAGSLPGDRTERDAPILTGVRLVMIADAGETTALVTELGDLDLALDDLGQLFAVENDRARLALEGLEEDGADLHRLDGMLAQCALTHCGTVRPRCECIGRRGEDGAGESQMPLPLRDFLLGRRFSV